jgi:hypothetical protein
MPMEVRGSLKLRKRRTRLVAFSRRRLRVIVTVSLPSAATASTGSTARAVFRRHQLSYENFYQAIRRSWRFGQTRPVEVHVVCADTERAIKAVIERKSGDHLKP